MGGCLEEEDPDLFHGAVNDRQADRANRESRVGRKRGESFKDWETEDEAFEPTCDTQEESVRA